MMNIFRLLHIITKNMLVYLSLRMEQLASHWKRFHKIFYVSIFLKVVEKN
jgi:hypothetical protein